jgi:hypothetical protein
MHREPTSPSSVAQQITALLLHKQLYSFGGNASDVRLARSQSKALVYSVAVTTPHTRVMQSYFVIRKS